MSVTRTADSDDDGTGTTGTIVNNSWKTGLYDQIDARWSRTTITSTGTQTVIDPSEADLLICNNAADLTIRSLTAPASPAKPAKRLVIISTGAGNVFLNHQDTTGTTAANRMINFATSGPTPLAAGVGCAVYVYEDSAARWRLISHEQGAWITPTFAAGNFTGTAGTWTVGSGDVAMMRYRLSGRTLQVAFALSTTTVTAGTSVLNISNAQWGSFTAAGSQWLVKPYVTDNGTARDAYMQVGTGISATSIAIALLTGTFAAATDTTSIIGEIHFEVA